MVTMATHPETDNVAAMINERLGGYNRTMGLTFDKVTNAEVIGGLTIAEQHLQPYGIVHGGVHAGLIEAACSTGAAVDAFAHGRTVVGLENSTSFIRAARSGTLKVTAHPLTRGRRTQVWEATVVDEGGRILATGRVRLLCLEAGSDLAGKEAG
jgi:uncharacterized protein (TIGR00369 family)